MEMTPARGLLLVKPVETEEHWGPLVLLEETRQRWTGAQCEVLAVGGWENCDDDECGREHCEDPGHYDTLRYPHPFVPGWRRHPCTVKLGDWLLVRPRSFVATDVEKVWVCKQSDVLAILSLGKND